MRAAVLALALLLLLAACTQPQAPKSKSAKELFEEKCTQCHSTERIVQHEPLTREEWRQVVERMRSNGCQLTDEEAERIADYLGETYGK